ncbi:MAG: A/G-specific adenine glycosylase [Bdellovibrionales bacterium]|nr:A/G-specific adenine glycosylase [Bdellovibrionales bacterium]NQZ19595.1 A/G-specific adenine glycosylase [Bdellovibrionales bacterium]
MSLYSKTDIKKEAAILSDWFKENSRPLPWRQSRDPYKIWISEIMLQQTTVTAVIPYFKKFIKRFPNKKALAESRLEDVYERWAGLGYYSRARSLHKAAQELVKLKSFPKTYAELIKLPGFGDYTSRAVSSQAFGERAGVVDGNVIRLLSRRFGLKAEWWKTSDKKLLQEIADEFVKTEDPSTINQALKEMGATVCTAKSPTCFICPINKKCVARKEDLIDQLPLRKKKKESEIWIWKAELLEDGNKVAFINNEYAPFLKKQLILPGKATRQKLPPKKFDFQHGITHHKIYVQITRKKSKFLKSLKDQYTWIPRKQLKEKVPFSLIQTTRDIGLGDR